MHFPPRDARYGRTARWPCWDVYLILFLSKQFQKHVAGPEEETNVHIRVRIEILAARDDICSHKKRGSRLINKANVANS